MSAAAVRRIELSADQAALLDRLMATGAFESESEAITASLAHMALDAYAAAPHGDPEFERFLREEVVPVMEELKAHPERAIPVKEAFDWILDPNRPRISVKP
jgi:antitoxin ParD1/3/4